MNGTTRKLSGSGFAAALCVLAVAVSLPACSILVAVDECSTAADCERFGTSDETWVCSANGFCEPGETERVECSDDSDCAGGSNCVGGLCTLPDPPDDSDMEIPDPEDLGGDPPDMGDLDDGGVDQPDVTTPDMGGDGEVVRVRGAIRGPTGWTNDKIWELDGVIFVEEGVTLSIERGTRIQGNRGSALVFKRGAKIDARGTADEPIVFSSSAPTGSRVAGDWGGIALLGYAPVNVPNPTLEGFEEPFETIYGGSNAEWSCGVMTYVRIEFAGEALSPREERNALTLGGCGRNTTVDHVQIHRADEDGLAIFGGTVNMTHVMLSRAQADSLRWDFGWRGKAQFVAVQQDELGSAGFDGGNNDALPDASPRSAPLISNYTIVGSRTGAGIGVVLDSGTAATLHHGVIMGQGLTAIDVQGIATAARADEGDLDVLSTLFFDVGSNGRIYFENESGAVDDDGGFDEADYFDASGKNNTFGLNPLFERAFDVKQPNLVPAPTSPANDMGTVPDDGFFDDSAVYAGAFAPGTEPWTEGWTDFSEN